MSQTHILMYIVLLGSPLYKERHAASCALSEALEAEILLKHFVQYSKDLEIRKRAIALLEKHLDIRTQNIIKRWGGAAKLPWVTELPMEVPGIKENNIANVARPVPYVARAYFLSIAEGRDEVPYWQKSRNGTKYLIKHLLRYEWGEGRINALLKEMGEGEERFWRAYKGKRP